MRVEGVPLNASYPAEHKNYSVPQAAELLGWSRTQAYRYLRPGIERRWSSAPEAPSNGVWVVPGTVLVRLMKETRASREEDPQRRRRRGTARQPTLRPQVEGNPKLSGEERHSMAVALTERLAGFPDRVRVARESKGWTQHKLAMELRVTPDYIGHIENGRRVPKVGLVLRMALLLEEDPGDFAIAAIIHRDPEVAPFVCRCAETSAKHAQKNAKNGPPTP